MNGNKREDDEEVGKKKMICSGGDIDLFYAVPEGCIAAAISLTGPRDASRLSAVSKIFKSAADSDAVWTRFLPEDYRQILARSKDAKRVSLSNKDLFLNLANHPLLIDNQTKSFFLDKPTGKKCFTISARELGITWGDTPRYWAFHPSPESRFPEVAELHSVCWLEITGRIKSSMLSPNTTYIAYFIFKMTDAAYGFYSPVKVSVKTQGSKSESRKVYLQYEEDRNQRYQIRPRRLSLFNRIRSPFFEVPPAAKREEDKMVPKQRIDGWLEAAMGEVTIQAGEDGDVEMSVMEIEGGNWKSGLIVEGIEIRPKVVSE
ncbi:hypothetical protein KSS87_023354 [Heliosperma pusillum]|nr:hypothetical protein KSS87_023354 [Heliosperma pusillum]